MWWHNARTSLRNTGYRRKGQFTKCAINFQVVATELSRVFQHENRLLAKGIFSVYAVCTSHDLQSVHILCEKGSMIIETVLLRSNIVFCGDM